jgi:hypothetical protein
MGVEEEAVVVVVVAATSSSSRSKQRRPQWMTVVEPVVASGPQGCWVGLGGGPLGLGLLGLGLTLSALLCSPAA